MKMKKTVVTLIMALALGSWCIAQGQGSAVQITNGPVVENVTDTTAQVAWSTNVSSGTVLHYGTDPNNLDQKASMPWGGMTHRVQLQNLKPGATYYVKAESTQGQGTGTGAQSDQTSFQTKAAGEQAASSPAQPGTSTAGASAPNVNTSQTAVWMVAGPIPQLVKDSSAQIWWLPSSLDPGAKVTYGASSANMNLTASATPETNGSGSEVAELSNLQPDTTYYFAVWGQNGNTIAGGQLKTAPANYAANQNLWITKGPVLEMIGPHNAIVAWSTNARAGSVVRYGTDPNGLSQTATAPWGQDTHRVRIHNLQPNTKYYFKVESTQAQGTNTQAQSQTAPFHTVPEGQAAVRNAQQPQ